MTAQKISSHVSRSDGSSAAAKKTPFDVPPRTKQALIHEEAAEEEAVVTQINLPQTVDKGADLHGRIRAGYHCS